MCSGVPTSFITRYKGDVRCRKCPDYRVVCCGMLLASGGALPSLQKILASHALIHTAEGEFFRSVVREACESLGIPVIGIRERELDERANATFGNRASSVRRHISELGEIVG